MTKVICNKASNCTRCKDCSGSKPHEWSVTCCNATTNSPCYEAQCLPVDEVINPEEITEELNNITDNNLKVN